MRNITNLKPIEKQEPIDESIDFLRESNLKLIEDNFLEVMVNTIRDQGPEKGVAEILLLLNSLEVNLDDRSLSQEFFIQLTGAVQSLV